MRNSAPRLLVGHWWYLGEFIYAIGLGSLAPPWGFVILVLGEALRLTRLIGRESGNVENLRPGATIIPRWVAVAQRNGSGTMWGMAFRREIVKWAILISMIVFVITLKDRVVETLLVTSFLLGLLVNSRLFGVFSSAESA